MLGADAGRVARADAARQGDRHLEAARAQPHFELLGSALLQRRRLQLRYFKRSDAAASASARCRRSAWCTTATPGTWTPGATRSEGLRRFALDAVREAQAAGGQGEELPCSELEAALDAGYGIYGGGDTKVKWATLVFDADAAQWVASEEWHPQQKARHLPDGRYELQVPYADATELTMDILRHGDSVTVAGDKTLAAAIAQRLKSALSRYA
jgi:predicted DNA-binding transcriptional regulator YafY